MHVLLFNHSPFSRQFVTHFSILYSVLWWILWMGWLIYAWLFVCVYVCLILCLSTCQIMIVKWKFHVSRQFKHMSFCYRHMYENLIWSEITVAPCWCLLRDPISAQIPFLLCLRYVLCASFIPVHQPLRIWFTVAKLGCSRN